MKSSGLSRTPKITIKSTTWSPLNDSILIPLAFIGQRLAFGVLVLLFIIFLSYLGLDMASGTDFSTAFRTAIPDTIAYVERLLQGDMGMTTSGSITMIPRPVTDVIQELLPRSLALLGSSLLFASLVGITLGIRAALNRSQRSLGILILTTIGISIPSFFAAFLLQWAVTSITRKFGYHILPVGGFGWDARIILPMIVLAARPIAQITRMTFVSIRQVKSQDYVRTAYSKGVHRYQIMAVHIMRNSAIPILTTIGVSLRFALSSLPVVELYFGWFGVGVALLKGIAQQDTNLVIGLTLCLGVVFILVNLLLELSYRFIDPRLLSKPEHITSSGRSNLLEALKSAWIGLLDLLKDNPITNLFKRSQPQRVTHYNIAELNPNQASEIHAPSRSMRGAWLAVFRNLPLIVGGLMVAALLTIVVFGPVLAPNNPYHTQGLVKIDGQLMPPPFAPNETYPWGTDALGRGILSLILAGAQQTLTLALLAVSARLLVGFVLGAVAGWTNGSLLDRSIVGLAEVISAFPTLLLAMILILAVGIRQGMQSFVIALCLVGWGEIMLFVRSEVITIRPRLFIESAVAAGARSLRIITRHLLPNIFSPLISIAALEMGAVLILLGELGFISIFIGGGAIIDLPTTRMLYSDVPEWGALLSNIRLLARGYPWTGYYVMMAFFVAILSFNLFGEGIRRLVEEGNPLLNRIINRYTVLLILVGVLGYNWVSVNSGTMPFYRQQASEFDGQRALYHASILSSPSMYGRALGSPGTDFAALYTAIEFKELGLQSAGARLSFFQERSRSFEELDSEPFFMIEDGGAPPVYGLDYAAYPGRNMTVGDSRAPVRFIALGKRTSSLTGGFVTSYTGLYRADFSGEILLTFSDREAWILAGVPKAGLLVVTDNPDLLGRRFTLSGRTGGWMDFYTGETTDENDPYMWISEQMADRLMVGSDYTVFDLRKISDELALEEVFELPIETKVKMKIDGTLVEKYKVKNVIGLIPGTFGYERCVDCLDQQLVVVIAQYDSPPIGPEGVYPAANDNASAVAVMLEAIRVLKETDYQPYRSFLFVAYSGEGLDGGEPVVDPDVKKFLQAKPGFSNYKLEAIVKLRGLGGGSGDGVEVSAGGSLRLAQLFERSTKLMGADVVRSDEAIDISVIYTDGSALNQGGQEAPVVRLFWEGWEEHSRLPSDSMEYISADNLEEAGRTLALSLMILGREEQY
ncbi:ABC transporter permease subunit [Chloroflexota bacterium]